MVLRAGGLAVGGSDGEQPALRGRCVALVDCEGSQHEVAQRGRLACHRSLAQPGRAFRLPVGQQQAHRRQQEPFLPVWHGAERPGPQQVGRSQRHRASLQLPEGSRLEVVGQAVIDLVGGRYPVRERGACVEDLRGGAVQGLAAGGRQVLIHRGAVQRMRELDRRLHLTGLPGDESGREQALQRWSRLAEARDAADFTERAALVDHAEGRGEQPCIRRQRGQLGNRRQGQGTRCGQLAIRERSAARG